MGHIRIISESITLDPEKEMIVIKFDSEKAKQDTIRILQGMGEGMLHYIEAPGELSREEFDKKFIELVPDYKEPEGCNKDLFERS